ncbi:hypothetical protein HDU93_004992 [Gonapodya sp. JEL0774]|nr:hypothetical protein HDU93_004992 [Gonapodya sp. JEL0774]
MSKSAKSKAAPKKVIHEESVMGETSSAEVPAEHPPYVDMIIQAITNLKERNGSTRSAIKKYIHANYKGLGEKFDDEYALAVKKGVDSGAFVLPKGPSASDRVDTPTGPVKLAKADENTEEKKSSKKATTKPKAAPKEKACSGIFKSAAAPREKLELFSHFRPGAASPNKAAEPKKAAPSKKSVAPKKTAPPPKKVAAAKAAPKKAVTPAKEDAPKKVTATKKAATRKKTAPSKKVDATPKKTSAARKAPAKAKVAAKKAGAPAPTAKAPPKAAPKKAAASAKKAAPKKK